MHLTYLYHSGFLVETDNAYLVFDYFLDGAALTNPKRTSAGVYPYIASDPPQKLNPYLEFAKYFSLKRTFKFSQPLQDSAGVIAILISKLDKPCYFFASHFHGDHFNSFILQLFDYIQQQRQDNPQVMPVYLICSRDIKKYRSNVIKHHKDQINFLLKGQSLQLPDLNVLAFGSTDIGDSFVVEIDNHTFFHAGDLNYWHWRDESTQEEIQKAKRDFDKEISIIADQFGGFDLAMFPCDPRMTPDYMAGAISFLQTFEINIFVPMHMWELEQNVLQTIQNDPYLQKLKVFYGHTPKMQDNPTHTIWIPQYSGDQFCFNLS